VLNILQAVVKIYIFIFIKVIDFYKFSYELQLFVNLCIQVLFNYIYVFFVWALTVLLKSITHIKTTTREVTKRYVYVQLYSTANDKCSFLTMLNSIK